MIKVKWVPIADADIAHFKIFRSMIGFKTTEEAPFGLVAGDTLQLKINDAITQTITFTGDSAIQDIVDLVNASISGGTAYASGDFLIVRSNIRSEPGFITIVGGTALTKLGLTARTISAQSETELIGVVPFGTSEFEDADGVLEDYYGISTVDSLANESNISSLRQAINFSGPICVVEGCITDLQGRRIPDVKVTAKVITPPESVQDHTFITKDTLSVLSGEDGRFSLPLLQKAEVLFEIDGVRVSDPIFIPELPYVFFDSLDVSMEYYFKDRV